MKINKNDSYRDCESCLSKELKSIKNNVDRWAYIINILLTFSCVLLDFLSSVVAALQPPDKNGKKLMNINLHLLISGDLKVLSLQEKNL